MRSRRQLISEYATSHRNHTNQLIHMICVPLIFIASAGLLWLVPVGQLIVSAPTEIAHEFNLAVLAGLLVLVFYGLLGVSSFIIGLIWVSLSIVYCKLMQTNGWPLFWISLITWFVAWTGQFYGHHIEGVRPSFSKDLLFLLVGPLYVSEKFITLYRTGSIYTPVQ